MTVAFKTFGCRLNRAETAQFEASFAAAGFACVPFGAPADIVVFHTCAVTQSAESECLKLIRAIRKKEPETVLVLTGCAVEAVLPEKLDELGADLIVPREKKDELVALVARHVGQVPCPGPAIPLHTTKRASLKIQDGCDFFCSYCIVPHTRGMPRSRPFDDCLREAQTFLRAGFQEIVVTGCNIACYADGGRNVVDLLAALSALPGLGRIRLGSIEPGTVEGEVAALMARTPKLCNFLHLPLQSGDNAVLARMGRRYTVEAITATLRNALDLMPDLALGADFICGFPGETDEAFEHTLQFVEAFPFSKLHVFSYSERPGTPACGFDGKIPVSVRKDRTKHLIAVGEKKRDAFAQRFVDKPVELLVEYFDGEGRACGWSGEYLHAVVSGVPRDRRCQLCAFRPDHVHGDTLYGAIR